MNDTHYEVLYHLQHRLMPQAYFEDRERLVFTLAQNEDFLFEVTNDIFEKEGESSPYRKEEFQAEPRVMSKKLILIILRYPLPEETPLCYESYMLFAPGFEQQMFFCLEKAAEEGTEPFLCGWNKEGEHLNYGRCPLDTDQAVARCLDIYLGLEGSERRWIKPS